ncbi:MAG: redoxin domain-containing protein [Bacteroidota bacterium]
MKTKLPESFFSMYMKTTNGNEISLAEIKNKKAAVFMFLSPECPICQNYSLTMNKLMDSYSSKGIAFYGIFNDRVYSKNQIDDYMHDYGMKFIPILDSEKLLKKTLNAKLTPEVFVVLADGSICYHGAIDNWYFSLGKHRTVITENYLQDILDKIINDKTPEPSQHEAIGCIIED